MVEGWGGFVIVAIQVISSFSHVSLPLLQYAVSIIFKYIVIVLLCISVDHNFGLVHYIHVYIKLLHAQIELIYFTHACLSLSQTILILQSL